jgi:ankyrin repeat protein
MLELLPEPTYDMTPLYAAAFNGDIDTIHKLATLGFNPNMQNKVNGYTALHAAVFRSKKESVFQLLHSFRGQIRLEVRDYCGDTALHLASRIGHKEITSAICEEDTCDPLSRKNNRNELPLQIARSHEVFQLIKICIDRNQLRRELNEIRKYSKI